MSDIHCHTRLPDAPRHSAFFLMIVLSKLLLVSYLMSSYLCSTCVHMSLIDLVNDLSAGFVVLVFCRVCFTMIPTVFSFFSTWPFQGRVYDGFPLTPTVLRRHTLVIDGFVNLVQVCQSSYELIFIQFVFS